MQLPVSDDKSGFNDVSSGRAGIGLVDLGQLIRRRRQFMELTLDQLAATTGISKPYLSNIENARLVGPPSDDKLTLIEKALTLADGDLVHLADWLRTPQTIRQFMQGHAATSLPRHHNGSIDLDSLLRQHDFSAGLEKARSSEAAAPSNHARQFPTLINIPLINRVAAGSPAEFTDLDYPAGIADRYIPAPSVTSDPSGQTGNSAAGMLALRVDGDSMSPQYRPGDIIVFSTVDTPADGDDCLIRLNEIDNFATTFKRIYFVDAQGHRISDGDHVQLCPLNPRHAQRIVAREQITSLYPSVWKITPTPRRTPADQTSAQPADAQKTFKQRNGKRSQKRNTASSGSPATLEPALESATAPVLSAEIEQQAPAKAGNLHSVAETFLMESD